MAVGPIQILQQATPGQRRTLLAAALGWMLDSFDAMLYALVLAHVMRDLGMTKGTAGLLSTLMLLASGIGGILFGFLADRVGRKRALMLSIVTYSVCSFASGLSTSILMLAVFRFILGLGMGGEWNTGATLVAETWPDELRAKALAIVQSSWAIGYALAALVAGIVLRYANWRAVFFVGILPAAVTLWIRNRVPESEMWKEHRRLGRSDQSHELEPQRSQRTQRDESFFAIFLAPYLKSTLRPALPEFFRIVRMVGIIPVDPGLPVAARRARGPRLRNHGHNYAAPCPQPVRHVPRIRHVRLGSGLSWAAAILHALPFRRRASDPALCHGTFAIRPASPRSRCGLLRHRLVFRLRHHRQRNLPHKIAGARLRLYLHRRTSHELRRPICDMEGSATRKGWIRLSTLRSGIPPGKLDGDAAAGNEGEESRLEMPVASRWSLANHSPND